VHNASPTHSSITPLFPQELLSAEREHRIDAAGTLRRNQSGRSRYHRQQKDRRAGNDRIVGLDAVQLRRELPSGSSGSGGSRSTAASATSSPTRTRPGARRRSDRRLRRDSPAQPMMRCARQVRPWRSRSSRRVST